MTVSTGKWQQAHCHRTPPCGVLSGCFVSIVFVGLALGVCLQSWLAILGMALSHLRVTVSHPKGVPRECGDGRWLNQERLDLATKAGVIHKLSLRAASTAPWGLSNSVRKRVKPLKGMTEGRHFLDGVNSGSFA